MESIFKTILVTSLYASIVGISILIIKTILKNRINPKWHYIIWFVLVLKLVIPFGPGSIFSLFNTVPAVPHNIDFSLDYETYHKSIEAFRLDNMKIPFGMQAKDVTLSIAAVAEKVLPYVWMIGVAAMLGWLLYTHFSLYRKVRKNSREIPDRLYSILENCKQQFDISMDIPIVIQDIIKTPAIFGIIKPKILVSPDILNLSDKDISYVFLHELAHFQRKDTAANYILLILQTIHWFNPVIWFCFRKIRQDIEVAADEKVLGLLERNEQKEYGKALLSILESFTAVKLAPRLIGMVDDKKNIERRIRMIKMADFFKSKRRMAVMTGVICMALLGGVLLTNAAENGDKNSIPPKITNTENYSSEKLIKLKNPYVGDHVKNLNLVENLPLGNMKTGISLQTEKEPYGMTVDYDLRASGLSEEIIEDTFRNNAVLIFALIDNLDEFTFDNNPGGGKKYSYSRSQLQQNYVKDLREYAKDKDSLDLLINSLSLRFQIYSEKYSLAISSVPGLKITARYNEGDFKVKYSVNYGELLNWNPPSPIENKGNYSEQPISTPVYWSPMTNGKVNTEKISLVAEIRNGTKLIAEKKLNIIGDSANFVFTVQPSADIYLENTNAVSPHQSSDASEMVTNQKSAEVYSKTTSDQSSDALGVVTKYFDAFAKADYKTMSTLATEHHNSLYIHKGDVFGMKWAKAKNIKYESAHGKLRFFIDVDMEAAEISAFDPEQKETSFYVQLIKGQDGKWRIDEYTTG